MIPIASPVKTLWQLMVMEQDSMQLNKYRINVFRTLPLTSIRFNYLQIFQSLFFMCKIITIILYNIFINIIWNFLCNELSKMARGVIIIVTSSHNNFGDHGGGSNSVSLNLKTMCLFSIFRLK